jgi:phosphatidyl-myo-inositol dimannoside synthase
VDRVKAEDRIRDADRRVARPAERRHVDARAELGAAGDGGVLRILLLATDVYGGHGGIALYNRDLAEALSLWPHCEEVVVVPRLMPNAPEPRPPRVTFIERAARGKTAYAKEVGAIIRRRRAFDVVICGHINLMPLARLIAKRPALMIYGIEAWKPAARLSRSAIDDLGAVVSISDITLRRFLDWSHAVCPAHLLPNAIRTGDYGIRPRNAELARRFGVDGKRVLLTFGRIVAAERYKGFDEVIDVLPDLPPDVVYLIAGSGGDAERLKAKARACGVGDRVVFTGYVPEAEKADIYGLADVYVMPSRGEGFGFVLLEAMASGVPVIASRHDGGYEAVRHGELGLVVDPSSHAEIRAAIVELLARNAPRAIPPGLDYFSFAHFVERAHAILETLSLSTC